MSSRTRNARVFTAALISIILGAVILKTLGSNPPLAGAFSLSDYYRLTPIEKLLTSRKSQTLVHWDRVNIYYSNTRAGNIKQLISLSGLANPQDIKCHFVVCNGLGGNDGQIQPTERWQRQWFAPASMTWHVEKNTIQICVIADGKTSRPTDFQVKRTEALAEQLSRRFDIPPIFIYYPEDWN